MSFPEKWVEREIMLSEISQTEKDKFHIFLLAYKTKYKKKNHGEGCQATEKGRERKLQLGCKNKKIIKKEKPWKQKGSYLEREGTSLLEGQVMVVGGV